LVPFTSGKRRTIGRHGRGLARYNPSISSFFGFLLDGQQRLTSLSLEMRSDADGELAHRAFFDVENEQFYLGEINKTVAKPIQAGDPLLVLMSDVVVIGRDSDADLHKSIERIIQALSQLARKTLVRASKLKISFPRQQRAVHQR
jgi:hypothetical protein